jgi:germination protein M
VKRRKPVTVFSTATALAVMAAGAVLWSCRPTPTPESSPSPTPETILPSPAPSTPPSAAKKITVYKVVANGEMGTKLERVEIPAPEGKTEPADLAVAALNHMASEKDSPLPKGVKALSVTFEDALATADFNKAFETNFPGGDQEEALLFNAVTATLGQFPNVKKVQILVEGKKVPLGGTQDTTEPLGVPTGIGQSDESSSASGDGT